MKTKALRLATVAGILGAALVPAAAAHADYGTVDPNGGSNPGTTGGSNPGSNGTGNLPKTGDDFAGITLVGAGLGVGGLVLVRANRRRTAAI